MKKVKKAAASLLAVILLCVYGADSVSASSVNSSPEQPEKESIGLSAFCDSYPGKRLKIVTDDDISTFFTAGELGAQIRFVADHPVKQLYFIFEKPCQWTIILPDNSVRHGGKQGYIHELLQLDQEISRFQMEIPAGSKLTDVYAFSGGELPDWVQKWEPPCQSADLMVMPTHADDEHLWFGGVLPYYAGELGYNVQVVYMTNHYKDPPRSHELLDGLWKVGVTHYPIIPDQFADHVDTRKSLNAAKEYFGYDRIMEYQVELLRRFSPKVIVAHDIHGEYGHGAHKLNAASLLEALKIYEDPTVYPESAEKYGIHTVQKCYLHLWKKNQILVQWSDLKLERFGGKSAFRMAVEGFACHKSQQKLYKVEEDGWNDCRKFGLAYTTVGLDTPGLNDMFEHVNMSAHDQNIEGEQTGSDDTAQQAVSETDKEPVASPSDKENRSSVWDGNPAIIDVVFIGGVAVALLVAMAILICLKRRE